MNTFREVYQANTALERHANWLDAEFGRWDDHSESRRVARVLTEIDTLKCLLMDCDPAHVASLEYEIATLEASIADFGF